MGSVKGQTDYDLDEQIRGCVLRLENLWRSQQLTLAIDLPRLPYRNNAEMMEHVWMNLISNAIKFSHSGGVIEIEAVQQQGVVAVSIRDEGVGISSEEIGHIFDKFYQADSTHSSHGNGLGLPLVRRIVQLSGGSVKVESQQGQGSVFTVTLPLRV